MNIHTRTPVVILALNLESEEVERAAFERAGLSARVLKQVEGAYKGQVERSYVVDVGQHGQYHGELHKEALNAALMLAETYAQESVLFLSYRRDAQLIFCNSRDVVDLGRWHAVHERKAIAQDAWTRDGSQYYIVESKEA